MNSTSLFNLHVISLGAAMAGGALVHCSSSESSSGPATTVDAGADVSTSGDGAPSGDPDASTSVDVDAAEPSGPPPGPDQSELEPNGGLFDDAGVPQTNAMTTPGTMSGAIDPADDADLFTLTFNPGELWFFRVAAKAGSTYRPHLTVFDASPNNLNPTRLVKTVGAGVEATLPVFVLRPGQFIAGVRDARNVPSDTSQHVGGAGLTYSVFAYKDTVKPVKVALPGTVTGALPKVSSLAIYSFTTTKDTNVEIVLKAARKASPSELDSRMSLFHVASKTAVLTNDNAGGTTPDSEIRGPMPKDGEYWVIVENEAPMAFEPSQVPDLSYELAFSLK